MADYKIGGVKDLDRVKVLGEAGNKVLGNVRDNVLGYAGGLIQSRVSDAVQSVMGRIPTEYLVILGTVLQASSLDPLQNILFEVEADGVLRGLDSVQIQAVNLPLFKIEYRTQIQRGLVTYHPKGLVFNTPLTLKLTEDRNAALLYNYITKVSDVYAHDDTAGDMVFRTDRMRSDLTVNVLRKAGEPALTITYQRCVLADINGYNFDAAGGSFVQPTLTLYPENIQVSTPEGGSIFDAAAGVFGNAITSPLMRTVKSYIGY